MRIKWIETTRSGQWIEKDIHEIKDSEIENTNHKHQLVLTEKRDQIIEGFGGSFNELGWIALNKIGSNQKEKIIKSLFDEEEGANFNFCRLPIGASDYAAKWYSHNEHPNDFEMQFFSIERDYDYLLPYVKKALKYKKDLKLFASPWSPPTWMKVPQAYNYGRLIMEDKYLKAYALYFLKFIQAYKAEDIHIHQVHIQNEPFADQKFPSCLWSGEQLRVFISKYLGPLFEQEYLDTEIWLGTLNGPEQMKFLANGKIGIDLFDEYVDHIMFDETATKHISGIGYQWAGREAIQRTRESYPNIKLMQTENECGDGDNTWQYARYVFNLMRHYLRNGACAYIYWNMILEEGGESTWGWHQNSLITIDSLTKDVIYNPEFYVMKHFSSFIKAGAQRIEVQGAWSGAAVAFENPNKEIIVVVANNVDYTRQLSLNINNENCFIELNGYSFNTFVISKV